MSREAWGSAGSRINRTSAFSAKPKFGGGKGAEGYSAGSAESDSLRRSVTGASSENGGGCSGSEVYGGGMERCVSCEEDFSTE